MSRITDPSLLAIFEGTSTGGLPLTTAKAVHYFTNLLLAARNQDDISVFAEPIASAGRHVVPVFGKWGISFVLTGAGPDDLQLTKLEKTWPAKKRRSSRPRRQGKS